MPSATPSQPSDAIGCLRQAVRLVSEGQWAHETRVARLAGALARTLGVDPSRSAMLELAASLHDIGKLAVPAAVLSKPGPLDAAELEAVRAHSAAGHAVLVTARDPMLRMAAQIAREHHEQWHGGGYPDGLSGEAISIEARIVTICDVYDALRAKRPYKPLRSHDEALHILLNGDARITPRMFDPAVLACAATNSDLLSRTFEAA